MNDLDEKMARAIEKLKRDDDVVSTDVQTTTHSGHRFPYSLRGITGEDHRYALPSVVAIGPWCNPYDDPFTSSSRGGVNKAWHLTNMEDAKWASAYWFCRLSGRSTSEVYEKVLSVVGLVRRFYGNELPLYLLLADDDGAQLATMMFVDGCFLLQYIYMMMMMGGAAGTDPLLRKWMSPSNIRKDIFMLDNQIPYLVLEVLMEFISVDVRGFIAKMGMELSRPGSNLLVLAREREAVVQPQPQAWRLAVQRLGCIPVPAPPKRAPTTAESSGGGDHAQDYKPPHLLGLLLFHVTGSAPEAAAASSLQHEGEGEGNAPSSEPQPRARPRPRPRSAAELARIGVKLTPASSATARLGDMAFTRKPVLFAELSLSPLFLNDDTACWLVNMAALEEAVVARQSTVVTTMGAAPEGLKLSSYLSVLAMLVDREEDVRTQG